MRLSYYLISPDKNHFGVLSDIQALRNEMYSPDGVEFSEGFNALDWHAWHGVCYNSDTHELVGCIRYIPAYPPQVGGWAVRSEKTVAIRLLFLMYALGQHLGGVTVHAFATTRHNSSEILERVGGINLYTYYDSEYHCDMCAFEFDTKKVPAKYQKLLEWAKTKI
jgi:hypothetical protein